MRVADERGIRVPDGYRDDMPKVGRIEAAFAARPLPTVPCHNDLLPGNVLFDDRDGRAWLLDFEYAGMNDRCFDLGNLSVNCGFDDAADEAMLHGTVRYALKAGGEASVDWAAYAHLVKSDGVVKMDFYQVYLVSGLLRLVCKGG